MENEAVSKNFIEQIIDKDIAHDGIHPSLEILGMHKFLFVVQCLQQTILYQIIGRLPVSSQFIGKMFQFGLHSHYLMGNIHLFHCSSFFLIIEYAKIRILNGLSYSNSSA